MYQGDSFFTLTMGQQVGLAALSFGLFAFAALIIHRAAWRGLLFRVFAALTVFFAFVWLSPQIYYQYYRLIIDGLPLQWVIGSPSGPRHLASLLSFRGEASLSAHSQGLLGWALLLLAIFRR